MPSRQNVEDEYRRLLSYQKIEELRAFARRWGVRIKGTRKASIVTELAAWLSEPDVVRARLRELDDEGLRVLTWLHLALAPDYGMSADNIVRGIIWQGQHADQRETEAGVLPVDTARAGEASGGGAPGGRALGQMHHAAIQERIATLKQRGLLLPFRQGNATFYSLPTAVRFCLPSRPDLFAGRDRAEPSTVQEITIGQRVQALYAVWMALAGGLPGTGKPLSRQALPPRQQIEDTWAVLREWNNDPDEMSEIAGGRYGRGRPGSPGLERFSASTLNWALTVVAPPRRLSDDDLAFVCERTGRSAPEIEFCYVLLEALGALTGVPGQPVSVRKEAMYRFLRSSLAAKVCTLWQAWTASELWSEMEMVLRTAVPSMAVQDTPPLRLRRSLAYHDFKPADLYEEWSNARQVVLRFLLLLDEERWVSVDRFLYAVYSVHPDLLHSRTDSSVWRLESPRTGKQFGTTFEDWRQSHGRFVLSVLYGPLYWLGLIRLGSMSSESPAPELFQLTPAGAFALGKRGTLPLGSLDAGRAFVREGMGAAACSVADDLTITLLPGRAPIELYDLVHTIGSLVEAAPDRFVYRLTASGVLRWAEAVASQGNVGTVDSVSTTRGICAARSDAIEALIATLSEHCVPPGTQPQVAADWQRKLRTWGENYGRLHIYEGLTLLELADDYALQELLASTSLREHIVYQFSPRMVAIQDKAVDKLVQDMEKRGYTPRVK